MGVGHKLNIDIFGNGKGPASDWRGLNHLIAYFLAMLGIDIFSPPLLSNSNSVGEDAESIKDDLLEVLDLVIGQAPRDLRRVVAVIVEDVKTANRRSCRPMGMVIIHAIFPLFCLIK